MEFRTTIIKISNFNYYLTEITKINKKERIQGGENGLSRRSISPLYAYLVVGSFS
jgi:hypothetical protein